MVLGVLVVKRRKLMSRGGIRMRGRLMDRLQVQVMGLSCIGCVAKQLAPGPAF